MKGSYFGFGSPQQQVDMNAVSKIHSLSYNMHLLLPYLLNDYQTICSTIHFSQPLLCVMRICGDWSGWSISFPFHKAIFVSAVLLFVQRYQENNNFCRCKSSAQWQRNEIKFSFRPTPAGTRCLYNVRLTLDLTMDRRCILVETQHKVRAMLLWYCCKHKL